VVIAALLGAEEFGFATAPLIVAGCVMMRVCHLDTCPVGIATQNPVLRERFTGKPEFVETFFLFLAEQVREHLAALGLRSIDEAVGRTDLLSFVPPAAHWKAGGLDLSPMLATVDGPRRRVRGQDHGLGEAFDQRLLPLLTGEPVRITLEVRNVDRSVGAMLGGEVARRFGALPEGTIDVTLNGTAGQSFGAFVPQGMTLRLYGDANDYLGKGLSGGRLVVRPPLTSSFAAEQNIIAGNTLLYGATGGSAFLRGRVGQRFAVRNSGAVAVVEGVGDHGCEYMTGGTVVVLGPVGRNFAAGMSGGTAYVLDLDPTLVNRELVDLRPVTDDAVLRGLVEWHYKETDSAVAMGLLSHWDPGRFTAVVPRDYQRAIEVMRAASVEGRDVDAAVMAEFSAPSPASVQGGG
jgi:glutamate synthase (NADPH) large chain